MQNDRNINYSAAGFGFKSMERNDRKNEDSGISGQL